MNILIVILVLILSERFYDFFIDASVHPANFTFPLLFLLTFLNILKINKEFFKKYSIFIILIFYCIFQSIFVPYINFGQSIVENIISIRHWYCFAMMLFIFDNLSVKLSENNIFKAVSWMSLTLIILNFYLYLTEDFTYFNGHSIYRFGELRIWLGQYSMIYFFIYLVSQKKSSIASILLSIGLFLTFFIVAQTRAILLGLIMVCFFQFFSSFTTQRINFKAMTPLLLIPIAAILFNLDFIQYQFLNFIELTLVDLSSGRGNISYRLTTLIYFAENLNSFSLLFGFGHVSHAGFLYEEKYFLSDVGFFSIVYYYGIVGLVLFLATLRKIANFSMHNTSTLQNFANNFVLFQFFAPTITNLESLPPMIFYIITLIFLNKSEIQ